MRELFISREYIIENTWSNLGTQRRQISLYSSEVSEDRNSTMKIAVIYMCYVVWMLCVVDGKRIIWLHVCMPGHTPWRESDSFFEIVGWQKLILLYCRGIYCTDNFSCNRCIQLVSVIRMVRQGNKKVIPKYLDEPSIVSYWPKINS